MVWLTCRNVYVLPLFILFSYSYDKLWWLFRIWGWVRVRNTNIKHGSALFLSDSPCSQISNEALTRAVSDGFWIIGSLTSLLQAIDNSSYKKWKTSLCQNETRPPFLQLKEWVMVKWAPQPSQIGDKEFAGFINHKQMASQNSGAEQIKLFF